MMGTVIVRSREQLDDAFRHANQVVVEGNDDLLSYAIEASGRAGQSHGGHGRKPRGIDDHAADGGPPTALIAVMVALLLLLFVASGSFFLFSRDLFWAHSAGSSRQPLPASHYDPAAQVQEILRTIASSISGLASHASLWVWPAVAVIAILALWNLTSKAIRSGNNVDLSWQVTSYVSGRLVITRVGTPSRG
jgi:hypothetical protein